MPVFKARLLSFKSDAPLFQDIQPSSQAFKGVSGACSSSKLGLHSKDAGAIWRDSTALLSMVEMEAVVGGTGYEGSSPLRLWILFSLGEPLPGWQVPKLAEFCPLILGSVRDLDACHRLFWLPL